VSGIVTLATDISERKQVMQELVRAKEAGKRRRGEVAVSGGVEP